jgi:hypothetical protein
MPHPLRQPAIQLGLVLFCGLFLVFTNGVSVSSQVSTCVSPPHIAGYPPPKISWPQGSTVTVKIDDTWTNQSDRNAFKEGIEKWNDALNCSGVTFIDFSATHFTDYGGAIPNNTVYWQRKSPVGVEMFFHNPFQLRVRAAKVPILPNWVNDYNNTFFVYLGTHELGHTFGLNDCLCSNCSCIAGMSIMGGHVPSDPAFNSGGPTVCDNNAVDQNYCGGPCQEYCEDELEDLDCIPGDNCTYPGNNGCPDGYARLYRDSCCCTPSSPILIDVEGNGFSLTNAEDGVLFDLFGNGTPRHLGWTTADSDDAWLVLDSSRNGMIDNGTELFGNFTPQPTPPNGQSRNGFLALAEYDRPVSGGDGDGMISRNDLIFVSLRLWRDTNHNGISDPNELYRLEDLGLKTIGLAYKESKKTDSRGNQFRYRAKVTDIHGAQLGRWAWDVFLVNAP